MFRKRRFFSAREEEQIISTIKDVERFTSGEVRLYIESECESDPLERGISVFHHLKLHEKNHRNGVLIYLASEHRKFSIVGDEGIHTKVPDNFWEDVKNKMTLFFKQGKLADGVCEGIKLVGEKLKDAFPFDSTIKDGYSDTINYGK
ncbi:MAG: TPM domain-containing protein [Bacteroidia bacterium]